MKTNTKEKRTDKTHEGAPIRPISASQELRRSVMSCMLFENAFYESGEDIADRIIRLADTAPKAEVISLAIEAREDMKLRHAPLLLLLSLIRRGGSDVGDAIARVIQRPDEMAELLALYWRGGKRPIAKQLRRGLAEAFGKFDEYQLAKYDRPEKITLRDVMFLSHPKPTGDRVDLYRRIAAKQLATPDTWEVALSGGADKKETFTRLITEGRLGYMALLRNLRNMDSAGVDPELVGKAIEDRKGAHRVLPFRFLSAARAYPRMEKYLDKAMIAAIKGGVSLPGRTVVLVDVSGSMGCPLSRKSVVTMRDAGASLAAMIDGDVRCIAFGTSFVEVPHRLGMAGVDAFNRADVGHGTNIGEAVRAAQKMDPDRIIVVTDGQSHDRVADPSGAKGYIINVAPYRNGVGYGAWTMIDGWSEKTLEYIKEVEGL